jgi:ribonuclease PH
MSTRPADVLRPITITPDYVDAPVASCMIQVGRTRVLCTASVESKVPGFRLASGGGWLTAEYSMLPGSSPHRVRRAASRGKVDGRSTEIQRLIGRSLRAAFDLDAMGPVSLWIDCDVIQADGGTRTASITGGYVAARVAIERLALQGKANRACLKSPIAAVSVGIVDGIPTLDLDYPLDSAADVDMNVVMDGEGSFVEVQGTAEGVNFGREALNQLLDLATKGITELRAAQDAAIAAALA